MSAVMGNPKPHLITADEYVRMWENHEFDPDARIELIEGVIVEMPPIGPSHASIVNRLNRLLIEAIKDELAMVQPQGPLRVGDMSIPQPDFVLAKPREDYYRSRIPHAPDALLAIEVSETTLRMDLRTKAPLYAKHGIPEYWVIDSQRGRVHFFRDLAEGTYRDVTVTATPGITAVPGLDGIAIDLSFVTPG